MTAATACCTSSRSIPAGEPDGSDPREAPETRHWQNLLHTTVDLLGVDAECREQRLTIGIASGTRLAAVDRAATEIGNAGTCVCQKSCGRPVSAREGEQKVFGANPVVPEVSRLALSGPESMAAAWSRRSNISGLISAVARGEGRGASCAPLGE